VSVTSAGRLMIIIVSHADHTRSGAKCGCAYRRSHPAILMVQSTQHRAADKLYVTGSHLAGKIALHKVGSERRLRSIGIFYQL
jgi:hypothetical protein